MDAVSEFTPTDPAHYKGLTPEPWDVIERLRLGYNLGSAVKYIARAGNGLGLRKASGDPDTDLGKAVKFLERAIAEETRDLEDGWQRPSGWRPRPDFSALDELEVGWQLPAPLYEAMEWIALANDCEPRTLYVRFVGNAIRVIELYRSAVK